MAAKKKVVAKKTVVPEIDENEDVSTVYIGMAMQRFDPMLAELNASADKAKKITAIDVTNKEQVEEVHTIRMELLKHRTTLEKIGKMLRKIPNNLKDAISDKEKELTAIVEVEERRLEAMENEAKEIAIKAERVKKLPERWERIKSIGIDTETTDELLLGMDAQTFENYYNTCVAMKNLREAEQLEKERKAEADRVAEASKKLDEDRLALEKERAALEAEKDAQNRVAEAKKEAQEEAKRVEDERLAKEAKLAEEAKLSAEEAKAKLELRAEYVKWREERVGTDKDSYKEENLGDRIVLWQKIGEFKIK